MTGSATKHDSTDDLVARFTVHVGTRGDDDHEEHVIVVPPAIPLSVGFERARVLVSEGRRVRLIGIGATVERLWPSWVRGESLVVAELPAYRARDVVVSTRALRLGFRTWLRRTFERTLAGVPGGGELLYGAACMRLFQGALVAVPVAQSIRSRHPNARIECVGPWEGAATLSGTAPARSMAGDVKWRARFAAMSAGCLGATVVRQVRDLGSARRTIDRVRSGRRTESVPANWVVLVSDWARFNRPLIDHIGTPLLRSGKRVGVLLYGTLASGARDEHRIWTRSGHELLAGVAPFLDRAGDLPLDQLVGPETAGELATVLLRTGLRASLATLAVMRNGPDVEAGGATFDLRPFAMDIAKLVTLDIARLTAAEHATRAFLERQQMVGSSVFFSTSNGPDAMVVDELLQEAGARTFELYHGTLGFGEIGLSESRAATRFVPTQADARVNAELEHQRSVAVERPGPRREGANQTREIRRVLIVSNYVHRDQKKGDHFPYGTYLAELLGAAQAAREVLGADVSVRWRPHPAEDRATVDRLLATLDRVQLSSAAALEEDLAWADAVVSSHSTACYAALVAGVPVFLHVTPEYEGTAAADFIAPTRAFFWARELEPRLASCVAELKQDPEACLEAERRAVARLYGRASENENEDDVIANAAVHAPEIN